MATHIPFILKRSSRHKTTRRGDDTSTLQTETASSEENEEFRPQIQECFSMSALSFIEMMQRFSTDISQPSIFQPGTKNYQTQEILYKTMIEYGISEVQVCIPPAFYEALKIQGLNPSEIQKLEKDVKKVLKHKKCGKQDGCNNKQPEGFYPVVKVEPQENDSEFEDFSDLQPIQLLRERSSSSNSACERFDGSLNQQELENTQTAIVKENTTFDCDAELIRKAFNLKKVETGQSEENKKQEVIEATPSRMHEPKHDFVEVKVEADPGDTQYRQAVTNSSGANFPRAKSDELEKISRNERQKLLRNQPESNAMCEISGESEKPTRDNEQVAATTDILIQCYLCGEQHTGDGLWYHVMDTHMPDYMMLNTDSRGKVRVKSKDVQTVSQQQESMYCCTHCLDSFSSYEEVKAHEKLVHIAGLSCYFCGLTLKADSDGLAHIARMHAKNYHCGEKYCRASFCEVNDYLRHVAKERHTQYDWNSLVVYTCHFCGQRFDNEKLCIWHFKHGICPEFGSFPAEQECSSCGFKFLDTIALTFHMFKEANLPEMAPYRPYTVLKQCLSHTVRHRNKGNRCKPDFEPPKSVRVKDFEFEYHPHMFGSTVGFLPTTMKEITVEQVLKGISETNPDILSDVTQTAAKLSQIVKICIQVPQFQELIKLEEKKPTMLSVVKDKAVEIVGEVFSLFKNINPDAEDVKKFQTNLKPCYSKILNSSSLIEEVPLTNANPSQQKHCTKIQPLSSGRSPQTSQTSVSQAGNTIIINNQQGGSNSIVLGGPVNQIFLPSVGGIGNQQGVVNQLNSVPIQGGVINRGFQVNKQGGITTKAQTSQANTGLNQNIIIPQSLAITGNLPLGSLIGSSSPFIMPKASSVSGPGAVHAVRQPVILMSGAAGAQARRVPSNSSSVPVAGQNNKHTTNILAGSGIVQTGQPMKIVISGSGTSQTITLPPNAIAGSGTSQTITLPPNAIAGSGTPQTITLQPNVIAGTGTSQTITLPPNAIAGSGTSQTITLPPNVIAGLGTSQTITLPPNAIAGSGTSQTITLQPNVIAGSGTSQTITLPPNAIAGTGSSQTITLPQNAIAGSGTSQTITLPPNAIAGSGTSQTITLQPNAIVGSGMVQISHSSSSSVMSDPGTPKNSKPHTEVMAGSFAAQSGLSGLKSNLIGQNQAVVSPNAGQSPNIVFGTNIVQNVQTASHLIPGVGAVQNLQPASVAGPGPGLVQNSLQQLQQLVYSSGAGTVQKVQPGSVAAPGSGLVQNTFQQLVYSSGVWVLQNPPPALTVNSGVGVGQPVAFQNVIKTEPVTKSMFASPIFSGLQNICNRVSAVSSCQSSLATSLPLTGGPIELTTAVCSTENGGKSQQDNSSNLDPATGELSAVSVTGQTSTSVTSGAQTTAVSSLPTVMSSSISSQPVLVSAVASSAPFPGQSGLNLVPTAGSSATSPAVIRPPPKTNKKSMSPQAKGAPMTMMRIPLFFYPAKPGDSVLEATHPETSKLLDSTVDKVLILPPEAVQSEESKMLKQKIKEKCLSGSRTIPEKGASGESEDEVSPKKRASRKSKDEVSPKKCERGFGMRLRKRKSKPMYIEDDADFFSDILDDESEESDGEMQNHIPPNQPIASTDQSESYVPADKPVASADRSDKDWQPHVSRDEPDSDASSGIEEVNPTEQMGNVSREVEEDTNSGSSTDSEENTADEGENIKELLAQVLKQRDTCMNTRKIVKKHLRTMSSKELTDSRYPWCPLSTEDLARLSELETMKGQNESTVQLTENEVIGSNNTTVSLSNQNDSQSCTKQNADNCMTKVTESSGELKEEAPIKTCSLTRKVSASDSICIDEDKPFEHGTEKNKDANKLWQSFGLKQCQVKLDRHRTADSLSKQFQNCKASAQTEADGEMMQCCDLNKPVTRKRGRDYQDSCRTETTDDCEVKTVKKEHLDLTEDITDMEIDEADRDIGPSSSTTKSANEQLALPTLVTSNMIGQNSNLFGQNCQINQSEPIFEKIPIPRLTNLRTVTFSKGGRPRGTYKKKNLEINIPSKPATSKLDPGTVTNADGKVAIPKLSSGGFAMKTITVIGPEDIQARIAAQKLRKAGICPNQHKPLPAQTRYMHRAMVEEKTKAYVVEKTKLFMEERRKSFVEFSQHKEIPVQIQDKPADPIPVVTEADPIPVVTKADPIPVVAEADPILAMTEADPIPEVNKTNLVPAEAKSGQTIQSLETPVDLGPTLIAETLIKTEVDTDLPSEENYQLAFQYKEVKVEVPDQEEVTSSSLPVNPSSMKQNSSQPLWNFKIRRGRGRKKGSKNKKHLQNQNPPTPKPLVAKVPATSLESSPLIQQSQIPQQTILFSPQQHQNQPLQFQLAPSQQPQTLQQQTSMMQLALHNQMPVVQTGWPQSPLTIPTFPQQQLVTSNLIGQNQLVNCQNQLSNQSSSQSGQVQVPVSIGTSNVIGQNQAVNQSNAQLPVRMPVMMPQLQQIQMNTGQGGLSNFILVPVAQSGTGNVVQPGVGNIIQPGMGNVVQPGMGNVVQLGMGNVVQPGMGNVVHLGMGNIVQPGMGNMAQPGMGNAVQPGGMIMQSITTTGQQMESNQTKQ